MALKLVTIGDHWNIIYSERPNGEGAVGCKRNGAEFVVPADVAEIRKRAFDITNCPNLQKVFIPEKVRQIHKGAFDGFDSSLAIECGSQYKPEGYFEGEYMEGARGGRLRLLHHPLRQLAPPLRGAAQPGLRGSADLDCPAPRTARSRGAPPSSGAVGSVERAKLFQPRCNPLRALAALVHLQAEKCNPAEVNSAGLRYCTYSTACGRWNSVKHYAVLDGRWNSVKRKRAAPTGAALFSVSFRRRPRMVSSSHAAGAEESHHAAVVPIQPIDQISMALAGGGKKRARPPSGTRVGLPSF